MFAATDVRHIVCSISISAICFEFADWFDLLRDVSSHSHLRRSFGPQVDTSADETAREQSLTPAQVAHRKQQAADQLDRVVAYAQNVVECRRQQQVGVLCLF